MYAAHTPKHNSVNDKSNIHSTTSLLVLWERESKELKCKHSFSMIYAQLISTLCTFMSHKKYNPHMF